MMKLLLLMPIVFIFSVCTYNPFYSEDAAKDFHLVKGKIQLADGDSNDNIYVWLEELNLSARTNSRGEFSLSIPRTDNLKGYNNDLKLYYYVGNYAIQHSNVLVVDGMFEYGKHDINNDGMIKETIHLRKLIDVKTTIIPQSISEDYNGAMNIEVVVTNLDTNILVINQMTLNRTLGGIIFRELNSPHADARRLQLDGVAHLSHQLFDPVTWRGLFIWPFKFLPPGDYDVYPYIFLVQSGIPQELFSNFGEDANRFTEAYLNVPFKHRSDQLRVN
jgi:hypothetical protein